MKLVPVIDLLDGQVVHAIAGERANYKPFAESRFDFQCPDQLVEELIREYQPEMIYVADLNAIQQNGDNLRIINGLSRFDVRFVLDCGFRSWTHFVKLKQQMELQNENEAPLNWLPVFGTETLDSIADLAAADAQKMGDRPVDCFVSLDLRGQNAIGEFADPNNPVKCLCELIEYGFQNIIVLDLQQVGQGFPIVEDWIPAEVLKLPKPKIFKGGGVHQKSDLARLHQLGYAGVLCASALHRGDIIARDFQVVDES